MNFLAHIYLSGDDQDITIGNFIADGIKGRNLNYPETLQKGILLHRGIDSFTDQHPIVKQSTKRLHKNHGHYSGVIVDIFYDHFLAKNWKKYHSQPLDQYVATFYELLDKNHEILPSRIQRMIPPMVSSNWLLSYASIDGISKILEQMSVRVKHTNNMHLAHLELDQFYTQFEAEFTSFFEELRVFSKNKITSLT
jgi:acyl carrier protein phosphodiesterase